MKSSKSLANEIEAKHGKGLAIAVLTFDELVHPEPMTFKEWAWEYLPLPIIFIGIPALSVLLLVWLVS